MTEQPQPAEHLNQPNIPPRAVTPIGGLKKKHRPDSQPKTIDSSLSLDAQAVKSVVTDDLRPPTNEGPRRIKLQLSIPEKDSFNDGPGTTKEFGGGKISLPSLKLNLGGGSGEKDKRNMPPLNMLSPGKSMRNLNLGNTFISPRGNNNNNFSPRRQSNNFGSPLAKKKSLAIMSPLMSARGMMSARGKFKNMLSRKSTFMSPTRANKQASDWDVEEEEVKPVKKPPSRPLRILRALVGCIGLGMACSARSKGQRKVNVKSLSSLYHINHEVFDVRHYYGGQEFKVFRVSVCGEGDNVTQQVSFSLINHVVHRWILTLMDMKNAEMLDAAFGSIPNSEDGGIIVTAVYSQREKRIIPKFIKKLSSEMEEFSIIREFVRSVHAVDPEEFRNFMDNTPEQDENNYAIGALALPTAQDLTSLPKEVNATIHFIAMETFRRFLYPRALLYLRMRFRKRLIEQGKGRVPKVTMEDLLKINMFKTWPHNLLYDMLRALQIVSFDKGEFIIHEDEQAGSGIYFLAAGSVSVWKKTSRVRPNGTKNKSIGPDNTKCLVSLNPVVCFGEFAFLTEEPRMASIRANTRVDLWVMRKHDFHRIFAKLPKSLLSSVISIAFEKRNATMSMSYPMTVEFMKGYPLFKACSDTLVDALRQKLTPCAVPKQHTIMKAGEAGTNMYFLRYGKAGVYQVVDTSHANKDETHVTTLNPGELIGDDAILYSGLYSSTIKTLTNCDLWALSKENFDAVAQAFPMELEKMMAAAR
eukprot:PhF_6_TR7836/c1_g4_i3/m.11375